MSMYVDANNKTVEKNNDAIKSAVIKQSNISDHIVRLIVQSNYYPNDYNVAKNDETNRKALKNMVENHHFTGIIFDNYIITDLNSIQSKQNIYMMRNGKRILLEKVGYDENTSVAVFKINAKINIKYNKFASPKLGDNIKIMGSNSVFGAMVSQSISNTAFLIDRKLPQHIYGGAVVNNKNELLGMIISNKEEYQQKAIAINALKNIISQIIKYGRVIKAFHGMQIENGIIISVEKNSPAQAAGLTEGFIIKKVNDKLVSKNADLDKYKPGEILKINFEFTDHNGIKHAPETRLVLSENVSLSEPITNYHIKLDAYVFMNGNNSAYLQGIENTPQELQEYAMKSVQKLPRMFNKYKTEAEMLSGILVLDTENNSVLKYGDIIKLINHEPATMLRLHSNYTSLRTKQRNTLTLSVIRNGKLIQIPIK